MEYREKDESYTFNPIGKTSTGSIYDADEITTEAIERMIQGQNKKDEINKQIINDLLKEFPNNYEDLKLELQKVNYRLDLMKQLVEGYRNQFLDVAKKFEDDFSPEANEMVNNKLTEYLSLIETLKNAGYNFGSTPNSYNDSPTKHQFDPYKPEMLIAEITGLMHMRRQNGANINIIFPVNYDFTDKEGQPKNDAVTIIYNVENHLKNNPYMDMLWKKAGYVSKEDSQERNI